MKDYKVCAEVFDEYTTCIYKEVVKGIITALRSLGEFKMMGADFIEIVDIETDTTLIEWEPEIEVINI